MQRSTKERNPDLRNSRYHGLDKAHVQNVLSGMALNITRLGAHFGSGARKRRQKRRSDPAADPPASTDSAATSA
ncbi:hypothetical protein AB0B12_32095 [Streptomyces sp. NPDC044780]|uniref:hypothetical protein n=1 Tax=unclassified Streptomyces TaxID=2593676 RepID=UPI0033EADCB4